MEAVFLNILNMSFVASFAILAIILACLLFRKLPKIISYALWSVAAFRLVIPFSFESMMSFFPKVLNTNPIPNDIGLQVTPQINSGVNVVDNLVNQSLPEATPYSSINPLQVFEWGATIVWIAGISLLICYFVYATFKLKKQTSNAKWLKDNIYEMHNLETPFVFGFIKPKIYIPANLNNEELKYIILHEQVHIKRKDHIIKIIGFAILTIHWFNPLVWIAFVLMNRDMEFSCDEKVLKLADDKKSYATTLVSLATEKKILHYGPVAFSTGDVKKRVENILNYKKPKMWVTVISVCIVGFIGFGLMTNPVNSNVVSEKDIDSITVEWAEALWNRSGEARYELMGQESKDEYYQSLVDVNGEENPWTIGVPELNAIGYEIECSGNTAWITYMLEDSETTSPGEYIYQEQVFMNEENGNTVVDGYVVHVSYLQKDLYENSVKIQEDVNNGKERWRVNPEEVAKVFVQHNFEGAEGEVVSVDDMEVVVKVDNEEVIIHLYRLQHC